MMSLSLSYIVVLNIKSANYCCIIRRVRKSECTTVMKNIDLTEKKVEHYET